MDYTIDESEWQKLEGKVILVIGATSGIGRASVEIAHNESGR